MNKIAFYCAYHKGDYAKKILANIPLDKCASENRVMTEIEFSTMVEKTAGFGDMLSGGWDAVKQAYAKNPQAFHAAGGALVAGGLGGMASKAMGYGFMPGALAGAGAGGLAGWKWGDKGVEQVRKYLPGQTNTSIPEVYRASDEVRRRYLGYVDPQTELLKAPSAITLRGNPSMNRIPQPNTQPGLTLTPENTQAGEYMPGPEFHYGQYPVEWQYKTQAEIPSANPAVAKAKVMAEQAQIDAQVAQANAQAAMQKAQIQEKHDGVMEQIKMQKEKQRQEEMKQKQMMEGIKQHMQTQQSQPQIPGQPVQPAMRPGMPPRPGTPSGPMTPGAPPAVPVR